MRFVLCLLVVVLCWSAPVVQADSSHEDSSLEETFAPLFALPNLEGAFSRLADLLGVPIVINFWASWCGPCQMELPYIEKLHREAETEADNPQLIILTVNLLHTERGGLQAVKRFMEKHHYSFPVLLDWNGRVAQAYHVRAIPTTFFLNPDGSVHQQYVGALNEERLRTIIDELTP